MSDIYNFVLNSLVETCGVNPEDISPVTNLFRDLGIGSVDFLDAVYAIDKEYGIRVPIGQMMNDVNEGNAEGDDHFVMQNFVETITRLVEEANVKSS